MVQSFKQRCFDRLPPEAQEEVLRLLNEAMLWRGWDERGFGRMDKGEHARQAVLDIAALFARHCMEIEELT